jgi:acyl-CoA thioester hydrolase
VYRSETTLRVRYGETDRMGFLFHAHYANYYEVGRTECIRQLGLTYREIEDAGVLMPVTDLSIKFLLPAGYDETIKVISTIPTLPAVRMVVHGEMQNEQGQVINRSEVKLTFLEASSKRIVVAPDILLTRLQPFFAPA